MSIYNCDKAGNQSIIEMVVFAVRLLSNPSWCVQWYSEARQTENLSLEQRKFYLSRR